MAGPNRIAALWFAHGPLGRWGRSLGFRWVFPVGTLPIPFHPLIPFAMLATPVIWLAATVIQSFSNGSGDRQWLWMLLSGVLLGIPLSIPIVSWGFRAFGGMLAQSLLFLAAMVALAFDVFTGRQTIWWALLPAGYVCIYVIERVSGLLRLRRYRNMHAGFTPVPAGHRTVMWPSDKPFVAVSAIRQGLLDCAWVAKPVHGEAQLIERIDTHEGEALQNLGRKGLPRGWRLEHLPDGFIVMRPAPSEAPIPPGPVLEIGIERIGRKVGRTAGVVHWRLRDGATTVETVSGTARIAGPLPFAILFYAISLNGTSQWFAGFVPRDVRLGTYDDEDPAHILAPPSAMAQRSSFQRDELMAAVRSAYAADDTAERERAVERRDRLRQLELAGVPTRVMYKGRELPSRLGRADIGKFWREVAANPARWKSNHEAYLVLAGTASDRDREDLRRTLDWLEAAIAERQREAIIAAAKLLAAMDTALLASEHERLARIFDSRVLGMVWMLTPELDRKPLPRKIPVSGDEGGYGLIRTVPMLYDKLAQLGPAMEAIVIPLVEEAASYAVPLTPELAAMARPPAARG